MDVQVEDKFANSQVQGVFFRANSADEAKRLGVVGWVRNTPTGSVEGEAQGSHQQLESFKVSIQPGVSVRQWPEKDI